MGAVHKFDLTSDVTHLIVGDTDTPKYKFVAKERFDVKCLLPSWIDALRESWMAGGDTDVPASEEVHKLPTFNGLRICVTGYVDDYRKELERKITANGGEYKPNLTKEETHLVAKGPFGAKYDFAAKWGIKTVAVEWLDQSLERGMILEETLFHPLLPSEKRGVGACTRKTTTSLGKRTYDKDEGPSRPRKLKRAANAKLESQNNGLWNDIVMQAEEPEPVKKGEWAEGKGPTEADTQGQTAINNAITDPGSRQDVESMARSLALGDVLVTNNTRKEDIFQGKMVSIHGFGEIKTSILEKHLVSRGAITVDFAQLSLLTENAESDDRFLLIPHTMGTDEVPAMASGTLQPILVTDLWVERCLHRREYEAPSTSVTNTPFPHRSIPDFHSLTACSTAFQGIDLLHLSKAIRLMGGKYEEYFDSNASVLICNAVNPGMEKLRHAQLWRIPAVRAEWLWDCIRKGKLVPFKPYLVQPLAAPEAGTVIPELAKASDPVTKSSTDDFLAQSSKERVKRIPKQCGPSKDVHKQPGKDSAPLTSPENLQTYVFPDDAGPQIDRLAKDDSTLEALADSSSSRTLSKMSISYPLQEITPNSSPPKPLPQEETPKLPPPKQKSPSPRASKSPVRPPPDDHSLGPAISSLLAHHQRTSSNAAARKPFSVNNGSQPRRRRRQLLGRAPSNLSSHSLNLSRASSVDTMNTDGLGTPLDSSLANSWERNGAASRVVYDIDHEEERKKQEEQMQMTQLGYEDPDVKLWRERVARKMGAGKIVDEKEAENPNKGSARVAEGLGIAKRTRQALAGR
ncbi:MAG: hypothetical protein Q9163_003055 [Psora crenata]